MSDLSGSDEDVIGRRRDLVRGAQDGADWSQGQIEGVHAGRRLAAPGAPGHGDAWLERHWSSRTLHRFGEAVAHSGAGLAAAAGVLVWLVVGIVARFPDWWETVLYAASSSVTLVMVFAIQHTQARQQSATQRKLDELVRAYPSADNQLIAVEEAPDQELSARATLNLADRQAGPSSQSPPASARSGPGQR